MHLAAPFNSFAIAAAYNAFACDQQIDPCFNSTARDAHGRRTPDLQDIHGQLVNLRARNLPASWDDLDEEWEDARPFYIALCKRFGYAVPESNPNTRDDR